MADQARLKAPSQRAPRLEGSGAGPGINAQARYGNGFLAEQLGAGPKSGPLVAEQASPTSASEGPSVGTLQAVGSTAAPLKVSSPLPVQQGPQARMVLGVQIIGSDVSPSALDGCEAFVRMTIGRRADVQERLRAAKVTLVILPRGRKMTDVAQFSGLRGTTTFDGRVWDDVRGSGGMRVAGGLWAIAVPEENLVQVEGVADAYGDGYSVGLHEFAHTIQSKGVGGAERKKLTALYEARKKANGPWTEAYGASNEQEYYAQSTNCFFGANGRVGQNGAAWLRDNDGPMYAFLVSIYGPPSTALRADPAGQDAAVPAPDTASA